MSSQTCSAGSRRFANGRPCVAPTNAVMNAWPMPRPTSISTARPPQRRCEQRREPIAMTDLILHSYDASPFTQRALKLLAIKGLEWRSVTTPMMPPKDDLVALTGGYRGTPVLQIGADIYIDSQRIAAELERASRSPRCFPAAMSALTFAAVKWADAFFRAGLHFAIAVTSAAWPPEFLPGSTGAVSGHRFRSNVDAAACARAIARQCGLHRAAIAGRARVPRRPAPGLWDVHAWTVPWFTRGMPGWRGSLRRFRCAWRDGSSAWPGSAKGGASNARRKKRLRCAMAATPSHVGSCDPDDVAGPARGNARRSHARRHAARRCARHGDRRQTAMKSPCCARARDAAKSSCTFRASAISVAAGHRRWSKRRPTIAPAILTFWMSIAPPAMPQPQASRRRRSIGYSRE